MWTDLRLIPRRVVRHPLVAVTAMLTLAVGVGAATTAFTLIRSVTAPLDYPDSGRLVRVLEVLPELRRSPNARLAAMWNQVLASYLDAAAWRQERGVFSDLGLYQGMRAVLEGAGEPVELEAAQIDAGVLATLGVAPAMGRGWTAQELARRERLILLAHDTWTGIFGADPRILGRSLKVNGEVGVVSGVMPAGFVLPGRHDSLWLPLAPTASDLTDREEYGYSAIGRLAPGVSAGAAERVLGRPAAVAVGGAKAAWGAHGVRVEPLLEAVAGDGRRLAGLLAAAAAALLLVACVNLAHLLLAQAAERRGETAMRIALGARQGDLLRQAVTESLALAVVGGAGGALLAMAAHRALPALLGERLERLDIHGVGGPGVLFALTVGAAATLAAGVLPVVFAPAAAPRTAIAEKRRLRRWQDALVVVEVALTLMLSAGAFALVTSWVRQTAAAPGFDLSHVLVQQVRLPSYRYADEAARRELSARLLAGLAAIPGTSGAALTSRLPLPGPAEVWSFRIAGRDARLHDWTRGRSAVMQFATAGYLDLLRVPLRAGEPLPAGAARAGGTAGERVVMVNQTAARHDWAGRPAVGETVLLKDKPYRVQGVFADLGARFGPGGAGQPEELMIQPWDQGPTEDFAVLVRVRGSAAGQAAAMRRLLRGLDPALPLPPVARLEDLLARAAAGPRARAALIGLLAGVALLLALIGTYGVMAWSIGQRRHEIAIRLALGAGRGAVRRQFLRRALVLAAAGVGVGSAGALGAGRLLRALLYGADAADALGLGVAAALLVGACLAAAYVPARRASQVDPASILRGG